MGYLIFLLFLVDGNTFDWCLELQSSFKQGRLIQFWKRVFLRSQIAWKYDIWTKRLTNTRNFGTIKDEWFACLAPWSFSNILQNFRSFWKNIFTQIFFIGQEKKRRAIPQFSLKETLYSDTNIFAKHRNKFVYIPIILCWQHNPVLISRPRFYLYIVYIHFSCWHKQTCSLPHLFFIARFCPCLKKAW